MNGDDINSYVPSLLNPRCVKKQNGELSLTQHSIVSRTSLSLRRSNGLKLKVKPQIHPVNKENSQNVRNLISFENNPPVTKVPKRKKTIDRDSLGSSAIEDIQSVANNFDIASLEDDEIQLVPEKLQNDCEIVEPNVPLISVSSNTELDESIDTESNATVIYDVDERPTISVSFGINHCKSVDINSKKSHIKRVLFSQNNDNTLVDCEILENSKVSSESDLDENMNEPGTPNSLKRSAVTVNLEIKKKKTSPETESSKVLILNTSAVEKISHVIVQPPNYKLLKISGKIKSVTAKTVGFIKNNGIVRGGLKQKYIDSFFNKRAKGSAEVIDKSELVKGGANENGDQVMSRKSGLAEKNGSKSPQFGRWTEKEYSAAFKSPSPIRKVGSPRPETASSSPRRKAGSPATLTPRHDSLQFSIPSKSASRKSTAKPVPQHKIVAGTHFAVDAFSYGDIPNVKHYFLTHFHSDHYTGLKKTFNKILFCSKITADLCISRLGVNPKVIRIIKVDEVLRVDNVEVTALEANHCPGAVMLVFTLPSGKTLLHTGDFRASPIMESYPIFWNRDIHTIYLDTTYCNPRYDFPTQDQSLEMALYLLRQKKLTLEKAGKKFSTVLIICGTYTIGKEKFFLGMSRRVGCSVWACPEKERVLAAVEGRSFAHAKPTACQLHVVPMRDLSHEKLRAYLDSFQGVFSEVVAFKPSGWENGKSSVEKDLVTIHGIPYSEHSSFSELVRFVNYLKPKQVVPTVDISGGVRAVQKYFSCPLVPKEDVHAQSKLTDFFSIKNQQPVPAVT